MRSSIGPTVLVVLAVVSVASCASAEESRLEGGPDAVTAALFPGSAALEANTALYEEAVETCMLREGFEYEQRVPYWPERNTLMFPTLGTWTVELADEYGFGFMRDPYIEDEAAPAYQPAEIPEEVRDQYVEAYHSCSTTARDELNGQYLVAVTPLRVLLEEMRGEFLAESRVVMIQQDWARCMRNLGYEQAESYHQFAQSFLDASDDFILTFIAGRRSTEDILEEAHKRLDAERRAALAAVDCAGPLVADYNEIWGEFQTEFFNTYEVPSFPQ